LAEGIPAEPEAAPQGTRRQRRQAQVRLTPVQVAALVADYEAGAANVAVARKYGVHHETAANHLRASGAVLRPRKIGIPKTELPRAQALRAQGWMYAAIGRRYGCSRTAASRALLRFAAPRH